MRCEVCQRRRWRAIPLAWAASVVAVSGAAGGIDSWDRTVTRVEELLRKSGTNPAWRAQQLVQQALARQLEGIARESGNRGRLASLLTLAAVAAQRMGDGGGAAWLAAEAAAFDAAASEAMLTTFPAEFEKLRRMIDAQLAAEMVRLYDNPPPDYSAPEPQSMAPVKTSLATRGGEPIGVAKVLVLVDEMGLAQRPLLLESSGHLGFDLAVMDSAREWVFRPAIRNGRAAAGAYVLTVVLHSGP